MSFAERRRFLWVLFLIGLAVLAVVANSTTLAHMSLEELAHHATAIARVRCTGTQSKWQDGEIWTETRFQVVEQTKGILPATVTVQMIGGTVGHLTSHVEGVPTFRAGEEAYLFLWTREGEPYRVLAWSQGTFRIARNPRTGAETVTQDSAAASLFDPGTKQFRHGGIRSLPVEAFQSKLREALQQKTP